MLDFIIFVKVGDYHPHYRIQQVEFQCAFNGAAHELAQYAKWNNVSHVWKDDFPLFWDFLFQSVSS